MTHVGVLVRTELDVDLLILDEEVTGIPHVLDVVDAQTGFEVRAVKLALGTSSLPTEGDAVVASSAVGGLLLPAAPYGPARLWVGADGYAWRAVAVNGGDSPQRVGLDREAIAVLSLGVGELGSNYRVELRRSPLGAAIGVLESGSRVWQVSWMQESYVVKGMVPGSYAAEVTRLDAGQAPSAVTTRFNLLPGVNEILLDCPADPRVSRRGALELGFRVDASWATARSTVELHIFDGRSGAYVTGGTLALDGTDKTIRVEEAFPYGTYRLTIPRVGLVAPIEHQGSGVQWIGVGPRSDLTIRLVVGDVSEGPIDVGTIFLTPATNSESVGSIAVRRGSDRGIFNASVVEGEYCIDWPMSDGWYSAKSGVQVLAKPGAYIEVPVLRSRVAQVRIRSASGELAPAGQVNLEAVTLRGDRIAHTIRQEQDGDWRVWLGTQERQVELRVTSAATGVVVASRPLSWDTSGGRTPVVTTVVLP